MQCGICDKSALALYSLFLCYPDNSILKTTVMDLTDNCIDYIFRPEETIGMLMGKLTVCIVDMLVL